MEHHWEQRDAFPLIARVIGECHARRARFVTHDEIVAALLDDPEGSALIADARAQQPRQTVEWVAHNMVAWFSQRITVGQSEWTAKFERERIGGQWAYKPKGKG